MKSFPQKRKTKRKKDFKKIKYTYPAVFILKRSRQIIKLDEHWMNTGCSKIYEVSNKVKKKKKKREGYES